MKTVRALLNKSIAQGDLPNKIVIDRNNEDHAIINVINVQL